MPARHDESPDVGATSFSDHLRSTAELARLLARYDPGKVTPAFREAIERTGLTGTSRLSGRARKVSVSMPEELSAAVQHRVGRGEFSHYVAEAVARRLELDLLTELAELLEAEHGPVPPELLAEAEAAWPDAE